MPSTLNDFDTQCLNLAIEAAEKSYEVGDFPVGAVLAINDDIIGVAGNAKTTQNTWVAHAENTLIINNGIAIKEAHKERKEIKMYSTLELCIQCLGASVSNRITQIFFIEKDPVGGACDLTHDNIGLWYREDWPKIHHVLLSDKPRKLLANYYDKEIKSGNASDWYKKCYEIYSTD